LFENIVDATCFGIIYLFSIGFAALKSKFSCGLVLATFFSMKLKPENPIQQANEYVPIGLGY
jgi:hypothetical protein